MISKRGKNNIWRWIKKNGLIKLKLSLTEAKLGLGVE